MRLLDRFLLRELAIPLAYCLAGFLLFWISFDLFSELDDFQEAHLRAIDIMELYWVRLPALLVIVLPVSFLIALLYTLSNHSRHHEITAIRAAGISLWRICIPYFGVGLIFTGALFWTSERMAPNSEDRERRIKSRRIAQGAEADWIQSVNFFNARANRIWTLGAYNPETLEMRNPQIVWTLPDGTRHTILARAGARTNDVWRFSNVQYFIYPPGKFETNTSRILTNSMAFPELTESPSDIRVQMKFSRLNAMKQLKRPELSLAEIAYIQRHIELNPRDRAMLETQRHARLAQPWTCLIVALIAIPFGAASGRRNVFIGVAASIFICFAYFILQRVGLALGNGQVLAPAVAGWFPNALFGATGLWLTHRVK